MSSREEQLRIWREQKEQQKKAPVTKGQVASSSISGTGRPGPFKEVNASQLNSRRNEQQQQQPLHPLKRGHHSTTSIPSISSSISSSSTSSKFTAKEKTTKENNNSSNPIKPDATEQQQQRKKARSEEGLTLKEGESRSVEEQTAPSVAAVSEAAAAAEELQITSDNRSTHSHDHEEEIAISSMEEIMGETDFAQPIHIPSATTNSPRPEQQSFTGSGSTSNNAGNTSSSSSQSSEQQQQQQQGHHYNRDNENNDGNDDDDGSDFSREEEDPSSGDDEDFSDDNNSNNNDENNNNNNNSETGNDDGNDMAIISGGAGAATSCGATTGDSTMTDVEIESKAAAGEEMQVVTGHPDPEDPIYQEPLVIALIDTLQEIEKDRDEKIAEIESLKKEIDGLHSHIREIEVLSKVNGTSKLESDLEIAMSEVRRLQGEKRNFQAELAAELQARGELQAKIKQMESQFSEERTRLTSKIVASSKIESELRKKLAEADEWQAEFTSQLEEMQTEFTNALQGANVQIQQLKRDLANARGNLPADTASSSSADEDVSLSSSSVESQQPHHQQEEELGKRVRHVSAAAAAPALEAIGEADVSMADEEEE